MVALSLDIPVVCRRGEGIMLQSTASAYLVVSAIVFGVVAVIHLVRALSDWPFVVGPISVPVSVSWAGFAAAAVLCLWAIRLLI